MMRSLLILMLLMASRARALMPDQLNYQGRMLTNLGTAVPDSASNSATFRIFNSESGGTQVWSETQTNISTSKGLFNVVLGAVNPLSGVPFDVPYWLEITWDKLGSPEVLGPRQALTSSPYAFRAKQLQHPYTDNTSLGGNSGIFISNGGSGVGTTAIQGSAFDGIGIAGTGMTGTAGKASTTNGIGIVAEQAAGSLALRVLGHAAFEAGGTTFFKGMVSFTGGTNLPPLSVPASLTSTTSNTTLAIYNTLGGSGGSGILGISNGIGTAGVIGRNDAASASALGVYGESQQGRAVYGQSSSGVGVFATSSSGMALVAQGSTVGVSATASDATGVAGFFGSASLISSVYAVNDGSGYALELRQNGGGASSALFSQAGGSQAVAVEARAGNGTAIVAQGNQGISVTATSSEGVSVYNPYGGTGVSLNNGGANGTGIFANINGSNGTGLNLSTLGANSIGVVVNSSLLALSASANSTVATVYGYNYNVGEGLSGESNSGVGVAGKGATGVRGGTDSFVGVGVRALNTQTSSSGTPAIALDVDGGITLKTSRTDPSAGSFNAFLNNLAAAAPWIRESNGFIASDQIKPNSLIFLTPNVSMGAYSNDTVVSARVLNVGTGGFQYLVQAMNATGDPGAQTVALQYLVINQR